MVLVRSSNKCVASVSVSLKGVDVFSFDNGSVDTMLFSPNVDGVGCILVSPTKEGVAFGLVSSREGGMTFSHIGDEGMASSEKEAWYLCLAV